VAPSARVNPALIRQLNTARIFHAVRRNPGASQRRLAELTGLDKATISTVVGALVADGLLRRSTVASGRPGRPEQALEVDPDGGVLVGARLELGSVRLLAATLAGEALATHDLPTPPAPEATLDALEDGVRELLDGAGRPMDDVRAIGVGIPALFRRDGRLALAPNLGWRDVPVGPILAERLPVPVYVDNDTKAAGLAETLFGCCRDVQDFVYVAGHSGIGGALYLGGRLYRGADGFAGELGHLKVRRGGRPCGCGGRGCLEAYLSETALLASAREAGLDVGDLDELAGADEAGDPTARAVLGEAGEILGDACADLVNLVNPERIVLGGAFATAAARMLDDVAARLDAAALAPPRRRCRVQLSAFGAEAVTMGGVALALEGFLSLPGWMLAREVPAS
jgi:predicted NBD/HSP70 family sugar kinase